MENDKLDAELRLALELPEEIRERTEELDTGYMPEENRWELIVQYAGNLEQLTEELDLTVVPLFGQYAVITIPENQIDRLTGYRQIIYIEKPKRLFFAVSAGKAASCINSLQSQTSGGSSGGGSRSESSSGLSGQGVLTAIIDSGIDYLHPDFQKEDGSTRILALWDQTAAGSSNSAIVLEDGRTVQPEAPAGFPLGTLYTEEMINAALGAARAAGGIASPAGMAAAHAVVPSLDSGGHGTHVAGIAAGGGRGYSGRYRGVAYRSGLIIVKLGSSVGGSFPKTPQLMEAVDFSVREGIVRNMPVAVNISFGNNYGAHNGRSLVESYMNEAANVWKSVIVAGTGNEGALGRHKGGFLNADRPERIEMEIASYETSFNLQLWKNYYDRFEITLVTPGGYETGVLRENETSVFVLEGTRIFAYYGEPTPYNPLQEIYFEFLPEEGSGFPEGGRGYLASGLWELRLKPLRIVTGRYDLWMPAGGVNQPDTAFIVPTEDITLTIPSTADRVISVAAYDASLDGYAYFSGRGFTRDGRVKPDIAAPGVRIMSAAPGGGYTERTGTSMATPFVSGSAALMMEWGIVRENDRYLYGEKLKAFLQKGARQLPGFYQWPNQELGYGALCLRDSLPLPSGRNLQ